MALDAAAQALIALVRARYGGTLTSEQLAELEVRVQAQLEACAALRAVPLENGDEPAFALVLGGEPAR